MRRRTSILLLLLVFGLAVSAQKQQQLRGQVINRDSVPQQCQVEFFIGNEFQFGFATDNQGYFYVNNPRWGNYRVVVSQGSAREEFSVNIDQYGLSPSTLVVRW